MVERYPELELDWKSWELNRGNGLTVEALCAAEV